MSLAGREGDLVSDLAKRMAEASEKQQYEEPARFRGPNGHGGTDKLGIVQVEQDMAMCEEKFPNLICKPIGAQFMAEKVIPLFAFEQAEGDLPKIELEKH